MPEKIEKEKNTMRDLEQIRKEIAACDVYYYRGYSSLCALSFKSSDSTGMCKEE